MTFNVINIKIRLRVIGGWLLAIGNWLLAMSDVIYFQLPFNECFYSFFKEKLSHVKHSLHVASSKSPVANSKLPTI